MAFELKNAPIEPVAAGDLRVTVKPGPDPQNPVEGGQMVFTPEPDAGANRSLRDAIVADRNLALLYYPHAQGIGTWHSPANKDVRYQDKNLRVFPKGLVDGVLCLTGSSHVGHKVATAFSQTVTTDDQGLWNATNYTIFYTPSISQFNAVSGSRNVFAGTYAPNSFGAAMQNSAAPVIQLVIGDAFRTYTVPIQAFQDNLADGFNHIAVMRVHESGASAHYKAQMWLNGVMIHEEVETSVDATTTAGFAATPSSAATNLSADAAFHPALICVTNRYIDAAEQTEIFNKFKTDNNIS